VNSIVLAHELSAIGHQPSAGA